MTVETPAAPGPSAPPPAPARAVAWTPVPRVNLLPREIVDERRFRGLQRRLGAAVLVVLGLCAAATVWAQLGVGAAEEQLSQVEAQGQALMGEQARYAEAPAVRNELDQARAAREAALAHDVVWYQFLADLALNTPRGTQLTSVSVSMDQAAPKTGPGATAPLTPVGLGTVRVNGKAEQFTDVATSLENVNKVHGLAGSSLEMASKQPASGSGSGSSGSSADDSGPPITFTDTAVVVDAALSHRYDRKAG